MLPSAEQLIQVIEKCKEDAIEFCLSVGLLNENQIRELSFACAIPQLTLKSTSQKRHKGSTKHTKTRLCQPCVPPESLTLKDFSEKFPDVNISCKSPYVVVECINGSKRIYKKSSLVWLFRKESIKLSSDRLFRVRAGIQVKPIMEKNTTQKPSGLHFHRNKSKRKVRGLIKKNAHHIL